MLGRNTFERDDIPHNSPERERLKESRDLATSTHRLRYLGLQNGKEASIAYETMMFSEPLDIKSIFRLAENMGITPNDVWEKYSNKIFVYGWDTSQGVPPHFAYESRLDDVLLDQCVEALMDKQKQNLPGSEPNEGSTIIQVSKPRYRDGFECSISGPIYLRDRMRLELQRLHDYQNQIMRERGDETPKGMVRKLINLVIKEH